MEKKLETLPRMSNWNIATQDLDGRQIWQCYRRRNVHPVDCAGDRLYDTEIFYSKEDAVLRCRELNAQLVDGWLSDGHPQNW